MTTNKTKNKCIFAFIAVVNFERNFQVFFPWYQVSDHVASIFEIGTREMC